MYNNASQPNGAEFRVNSYTTSSQESPSVAMDDNGNFMITWQSYLQDTDGNGVFAQRYQNNGQPDGAEFRVNTITTGGQFLPSVAMDSAGNFIVTWASEGNTTADTGIMAKRFNSSGIPVN
jgi:hypothetical protein